MQNKREAHAAAPKPVMDQGRPLFRTFVLLPTAYGSWKCLHRYYVLGKLLIMKRQKLGKQSCS